MKRTKGVKRNLKKARAQWLYRGTNRPDFAVEPLPGQESVWDYPRPPRIEPDERDIRVFDGETLIAHSTSAMRVLETAGAPCFYLAPDDVRFDLLKINDTRTFCEWKGEAVGYDTISGNRDVAWSYPNAFSEFKSLEGWIAFYASRVRCFVDDEPVKPQPCGYYGGWVTHEIVGPFKGEDVVNDALRKS